MQTHLKMLFAKCHQFGFRSCYAEASVQNDDAKQILVNPGSGYDLLPDSTEPQPAPMLTKFLRQSLECNFTENAQNIAA